MTLAVALMALKTLELRARRDAFVVFFLGFFIILTHFLYSQSLPVAVAMLVSVWGLLTAVVLAHMPVGQPSLQAGRRARRAHRPARRAGHGAAVPALPAHRPALGRAAGRHLEDRPVEHDEDGLDGRGRARRLDRDAAALRRPCSRPCRDVLPRPGADALRRHRVDAARPAVRAVEPAVAAADARDARHADRLRSDARAAAPRVGAAARGDDRGRRDRGLPSGRARRPAVARREAGARAPSLQGDRQHALRPRRAAPLRRDPGEPRAAGRLQSAHGRLGARLSRRSVAPRRDARRQLAQAVLQHIRTSGFSYTLAPGDYGRDGIDEFWLDRKEGFCEHFAAAFVVVMRAAGVPARIVTGYQGTDLPPVDGYYVVRQSSAHAWAEFWQSGIGWVRADPTGAVAPDRIGRSNRLAPQPGFVAGTLDAMNPAAVRAAAQRLGSRQQPLEPVGAQLLARPAARRPQADRLRRADLGGPRPPPRRRPERAGARRRGLGLARSPSRRSRGCASSSG